MKYIVLISCLLFACQAKVTKEGGLDQAPFFDLKKFFEVEQEALKTAIVAIQKKVIINGKEEIKRIDTLNLRQELSVFVDADINRPAWLDQYSRDSVVNEQNQITAIHYKALNDNLKTKKLSIHFEEGMVRQIEIQKLLSTLAIASTQKLIYKTGQGYTIKNKQELTFSDPQDIFLEVNYLKE